MNSLLPDEQVCVAYQEVRQSVLELLAATPESSASIIVPACPGWTVQQTASHLVGVPEDLLAGRLEGVASDAWTDAQVQRHSGETIAQLRDALEATVSAFDAMLSAIPKPSNSQLVMDALTHDIDLREALGMPVDSFSPAIPVARAWLLNLIRGRDSAIAPELESAPCSDLELVRSLTGRRSAAQMNAAGLPGDRIVTALKGTPLRPPQSPS